MGNTIKYHKPETPHKEDEHFDMQSNFVPVHVFKFMEPFEDDSTNGLFFNNFYIPEEIVVNILSCVPAKDLLKLTVVCKKWCNIVKSEKFWMDIYDRRYHSKAKNLPWYVYYCYFATNNFDQNLLKNGNGQNGHEYWNCDRMKIEDPPVEADPLPLDVLEFEGHTSCFAESSQLSDRPYYPCYLDQMHQIISFRDKRLLRYILNKFTPHIYVSEWIAGRYDSECRYRLFIKGYYQISEIGRFSTVSFCDHETVSNTIACICLKDSSCVGGQWKKVQHLTTKYPPHVAVLVFEHAGTGSKMAGGVVRIVFDSIQPLKDVDENFKLDF